MPFNSTSNKYLILQTNFQLVETLWSTSAVQNYLNFNQFMIKVIKTSQELYFSIENNVINYGYNICEMPSQFFISHFPILPANLNWIYLQTSSLLCRINFSYFILFFVLHARKHDSVFSFQSSATHFYS